MSSTEKLFFSEYLKPVYVYREAIPAGVRAALNYGLFAGFLLSWLAYFPVRLLLSRLLMQPSQITDNMVWRIIGVMLLIFVGLMVFVLCLLSQRFRASSRKEQVFTGAGVGFMFAMAAHSSLIGSVIGLLSNRDMLTYLGRSFNATSPTAIASLTRSIYLTVSEGMAVALLTVAISAFVGAFIGWVVLPMQKASTPITRDAFTPFFMLMMPPWFFILFVIIVVITALMEPAVRDMAERVGLSYAPQVAMVLIHVMPALIGLVIVQWLGIIWLWLSDPTTLHRSLLRMTQVFYGVVWTVGFPIFISMANPTFVRTTFGMIIVGLSISGGITYLILAQIKLRRAASAGVHIRVEVTARKVIAAGLWVTLIGCLLGDLLGGRQLFNLANILVRLIEPDSLSLNRLLDYAFINSFIFLAMLTGIVLIASLIPISVIAYFAHRLECQRTLS